MIIRLASLCLIKSVSGLEYGIGCFLFSELIKPTDCVHAKFKSRNIPLTSLLLSYFQAFIKIICMPLKQKKHFHNLLIST